MKYKALMLDVDGTVVPYNYRAVPSDTLAAAIKKAQEKVTVCLVTGRSFVFLEKVLEKLAMTSGYAVVNNGAQVIDIANKRIMHEQLIDSADAHKIISLFRREHMDFAMKGDPFTQEYVRLPDQSIPSNLQPPMFFTEEKFPSEKIDAIIEELSPLGSLALHKTHHKEPNKFGLLISHVNATKQNGIFELEKHIGVARDQMIGVGDSYNDFPLLMACGLKVAMGNAVEELKAIADYVAPSVDNDGVADVIEKFILNPH